MTIKRWIVTAVDFDADGQCDGKARVLEVCKNGEEAKNFALEDMREYVDKHAEDNMLLDIVKLRVADYGQQNGCEWNIEEVELKN